MEAFSSSIQNRLKCSGKVKLVDVINAREFYTRHGKRSPTTGRGGPRGSGQVKAPDFLDVWHNEGGRSSVLHTGRLYSGRNLWYSFLEAELTPGHMVPSVAMEKIPSDTTGNQS
jgi:hypothetical protein